LSPLKPFKTDGFPVELKSFQHARQYKQWQFVYEPATNRKE
jgi:hypothetical protein